MKYSISLFSLFVCLLALSGCFKNNTSEEIAPEHDQNAGFVASQEGRELAQKRVIGNDVCDRYLQTIQCLADQSDLSQQFSGVYESLRLAMGNMTNEQLDQYCENLADALLEHPTHLIDHAQCNIIQPDQERLDAMRLSEQLTEESSTVTPSTNAL